MEKLFGQKEEALFLEYLETGNEDLFTEIYPKLLIMMRSIIQNFGITENQDEIESICRYKLTKAISQYKPNEGKSFYSYVYTVFKNELKMYLRRKKQTNKFTFEPLTDSENEELSTPLDISAFEQWQSGSIFNPITDEEFKTAFINYWVNYLPTNKGQRKIKHQLLEQLESTNKPIGFKCQQADRIWLRKVSKTFLKKYLEK